MPPLPLSFDESTTASISAIQRRAADLEEFQIPRLRDCKDSLVVQQQYAAELREDLEALARLVEALEETIDDQRGERTRRDLKGVVESFEEDVRRLRKDTRAALLTSKKAIDAQSSSTREELLRSSVMKEKQTSEEKTTYVTPFTAGLFGFTYLLMKAQNDVTDALRRTLGLMQGELERSVLSTQMLEASTASLKTTSTTHDVLTGLLGTSKQLITALEKSDWLDRLLIMGALAFFLLVVLFILKQRIVDRGIRIAFWWTRFLPYMGGESNPLDKLEKGRIYASTVTGVAMVSSTTVSVFSSVASSMSSADAAVVSSGVDATATSILDSLSDAAGTTKDPSISPATTDMAPGSTALHDEL
ncbi:Sec20-domain-containing protein [Artomyces pyxidatus]|uniref:Sec20-domain-containing protein n=1 Tax=Artomyces pyxidatus TaxID=48021 RepID=A0ACB8T849_9AGAM|nr:Sec20-domain-containing protein [Artomyces pyxidatus]